MLAFAAHVPHPLISVPEIGKLNTRKVRKTIQSFKIFSQELYAVQPDIVLVISTPTKEVTGVFSINQNPRLVVEFSKYGDITDRIEFKNDIGFGYRIRESVEVHMPLILTDEQHIDYRAGIPLFHFSKFLDTRAVRVVPISTCDRSLADHVRMGQYINRQINKSNERVAIISCGDLAHNSSKNPATAFDPEAKKFNSDVLDAIEHRSIEVLTALSSSMSASIVEDAVRPIMVLLGILDDREYKPILSSFESVLGVGYLSTQFSLHT